MFNKIISFFKEQKLKFKRYSISIIKEIKIIPADYCVIDIAQYILKTSREYNIEMSFFKLDRLLYYIQEKSILLNKKNMFNEPIIAYKTGPFVEDEKLNYLYYVMYNITHLYKKEPQDISYKDVILKQDKEFIQIAMKEFDYYYCSQIYGVMFDDEPWEYTIKNKGIGAEITSEIIYKFANLNIEFQHPSQ